MTQFPSPEALHEYWEAWSDLVWFFDNPTRRYRIRPLKSIRCEMTLTVVVERARDNGLVRHIRRPEDLDFASTDAEIAAALRRASMPSCGSGVYDFTRRPPKPIPPRPPKLPHRPTNLPERR